MVVGQTIERCGAAAEVADGVTVYQVSYKHIEVSDESRVVIWLALTLLRDFLVSS
jgi:hypothetical protein